VGLSVIGHSLYLELNKLSPLALICCGLITFIVLGAVGAEEYHVRSEVAKTNSWAMSAGTITRNERRMSDKTTLVNYSYTVAGKNYTGDRIYYDQPEARLPYLLDEKLYPVGQSVQVHYNPAAPDSAVLSSKPERGDSNPAGYFQGGFLGLCLLLGGIFRIRSLRGTDRLTYTKV
jgi:Protein of unknown function (DUF3592)